jgi:hypothetical protein
MSKAQRIREQRKERERRDLEEMWLDPRLRAARARHVAGQPRRRTGYQLRVLSRVELSDGRTVIYPAPQIGAFSLVEAKRLRDDAEPRRLRILDNLEPRTDEDAFQPTDTGEVLDVMSALFAAVLFSFSAIESLANETLERLPEQTTWSDHRGKQHDREWMVRYGKIETKLQEMIPAFTDVPPLPRGRRTWQRFKKLKDLRDDLVHAKNRGAYSSGDTPAYGRLLAGEAATCVEDAFAVCESIAPAYFPSHVRAALGVA